MNQTRKDVLNGWKEIAAYLGRDPRTVERWEKQRSLPVRRLPGSGRATVYALVPELDDWLASSPVREPEPPGSGEAGGAAERISAVAQPVVQPAGGASDLRKDLNAGSVPVDLRPRRRVRWPWRGIAAACVALLCAAALAGAGWRRRHVAGPPPPTYASDAGRGRKLVPSSSVFGVEELYLRGCYQMEMRTPESLRRAQDSFSAAAAKDPQYAAAYAGLANTYILLREYSTLPEREAYPKAKEAAAKALALDPGLPQGHVAMGFVAFFWDWDAAGAERQFQEALQEDATLALAHHWYGSVLTHEGRSREGLAELSVAQRLDPTSGAILTSRAFALGLSGRRDDAADMLREAMSTDKSGQYRTPATMHRVLGALSLIPPRNVASYLSETLQAAELRNDEATVNAMRLAEGAYRAHGEQGMWRALLEDEKRRHPTGGPTYSMARYEAELGARDQALNDLADLFSRHDPELIGIAIDPLFAGLRKEPRFLRLQAAMGLPGVDQI